MRWKRLATLLLCGAVLMGGAAACAEIAEPDKVGIWYMKGQIDGNHFDRCVPPGQRDKWLANNDVFWVPNNVRTWNIAAQGGDTNQALVVTAKPEEGQESGLEVLVWTQTTLKLNTYCGEDEKDRNSPLVRWWESLGKRYRADTEEGWLRMLQNTVVPALEKAKNVLRAYTADELVLGTVWTEAEHAFAATFTAELTRLSGGQYFCGPDFDRARPDCSPVQVSIKDVDYRDPGIQEARNEKQKAEERAAAALAEAQGKVEAANAQKDLLNNPAWLEYERARLEYEMVKACAANPNCTIVLGVDGAVIGTRQ